MPEKKKTEDDSLTEDSLPPLYIRTTGAIRFCRAGQRFGRTAKKITDYTPEQLVAWKAEDYLIIDTEK
jgi:hypothetical protein